MEKNSDDHTHLIDIPPEDQMGPAMLRLNENQRRFVCALCVFGGNRSQAYMWAGYKPGSRNALDAGASALYNSVNVQLAIKEETIRRLDSSTLLAVSTLIELAMPGNDPRVRKDCAVELLNRTGFHGKTEHQIVIKDERTTQELIDFIKANSTFAAKHGIDLTGIAALEHKPATAVVDADFEEVIDGRDGLEDLL